MSELKCCPFCGGKARVRDCTREEQGSYVGGQMHKMCGCEHYCAEMFGYTEEEAIEKWNTRTPMANIVEKLEEESYETTDTVCGGRFKAIRLSSAINIVKQEMNNGLE